MHLHVDVRQRQRCVRIFVECKDTTLLPTGQVGHGSEEGDHPAGLERESQSEITKTQVREVPAFSRISLSTTFPVWLGLRQIRSPRPANAEGQKSERRKRKRRIEKRNIATTEQALFLENLFEGEKTGAKKPGPQD